MTAGLWLDRWLLERAGLYEALLGLDEETLARRPACGVWAPQEVLAHCAAWEAYTARWLPVLLADRGDEIPDVEVDTFNAEAVAQRRGAPLVEILGELDGALQGVQSAVEGLPPAEVVRPRRSPWGDATVESWGLRVNAEHNAEHAAGLRAWRQAEGIAYGPGPRTLLVAALEASRQALERLIARLPASERDTTPICGPWTLKDVVGHLADWEAVAADGAGEAPRRGALPQTPHWVEGLDAWNAEHVALRRDQPWEAVWGDYLAACAATDRAFASLDDGDLAHHYPHHAATSPYAWLADLPMHNVDHARQALQALLLTR